MRCRACEGLWRRDGFAAAATARAAATVTRVTETVAGRGVTVEFFPSSFIRSG